MPQLIQTLDGAVASIRWNLRWWVVWLHKLVTCEARLVEQSHL